MRQIKFRVWNKSRMIVWDEMCKYGWEISCVNNFPRHNFGEVMQYTGLKDKNGVEIYEGDILRGIAGNYVVSWNSSELSCGWKKCRRGSLTDIGTGQEAEIIGNIYETPELAG